MRRKVGNDFRTVYCEMRVASAATYTPVYAPVHATLPATKALSLEH